MTILGRLYTAAHAAGRQPQTSIVHLVLAGTGKHDLVIGNIAISETPLRIPESMLDHVQVL